MYVVNKQLSLSERKNKKSHELFSSSVQMNSKHIILADTSKDESSKRYYFKTHIVTKQTEKY